MAMLPFRCVILIIFLSLQQNITTMQDKVTLPQWLDDLIFEQLGAKYCRSNSDMTVIDWDKNDVLNYLGTYFPRSYAESYCIFSEFFKRNPDQFANKSELSIFDFGCGTGGEIIGLMSAISECLPQINTIHIVAMDGNLHSLRLFENIISEYGSRSRLYLDHRIIPLTIDDFYDLHIMNSVISDRFDIFMSFKAICEFVTKERFEQQNAYAHIANTFLPRIKKDGIMVLADVSTYNNVSQEWLPRMMDEGITHSPCRVALRNEGYNQTFTVTHQKRTSDISKIAWRIIQKL